MFLHFLLGFFVFCSGFFVLEFCNFCNERMKECYKGIFGVFWIEFMEIYMMVNCNHVGSKGYVSLGRKSRCFSGI